MGGVATPNRFMFLTFCMKEFPKGHISVCHVYCCHMKTISAIMYGFLFSRMAYLLCNFLSKTRNAANLTILLSPSCHNHLQCARSTISAQCDCRNTHFQVQ
ncbi:hypothetical protein QL285_033803 [Trifolium repens]|nr:hypothetical protein QL285_033803 [Trifolium repens]